MFKKEVLYYDYKRVYEAVYKAIETEIEKRKTAKLDEVCGCISVWVNEINTQCLNPEHIEKLKSEFDGMGWDTVEVRIIEDRTSKLYIYLT